MAYREVTRVEIQEIIRRWQAGEGYRRIASGTGLSRNTVRKYLTAAKAEGIARDGPVPTNDQLSRLAVIGQPGPRLAETPSEDLLAPWADQVYQWLTGDRLQLTRIHELLLGRGCPVSYQSLRRFIQKRNWSRRGRTTVRMEDTPPGEVAEVDFGRLGLIHDPDTGHRRAVWALIVVLGYSRHCFVWPTFGQKLEDVIALAWNQLGPSSAASPATWSSTISRRRWRERTHCIPSSPGDSWNTPSAAALSPTRPESGIPRTNQRWSGASSTSGSASSRAAVSIACHTSEQKRSAGAAMSRGSAFTAPPTGNHCWFSKTRSAKPWSRGMASPTRSQTGAPPRCIPIITSNACRPCTRCRPLCVLPVSGWRSG